MLPVRITIDRDDPDPEDIASYLAAVARRLDERPEPMLITVDSPDGVSLDADADGRLVVKVAGCRPKRLDLRRRWIADHPFPLSFAARPFLLFFRRRLRLVVRPVSGNRFRVRRALF